MSVVGYYAKRDPMNLQHTRTAKNTAMQDFNCGGYALGIFSWYLIDYNVYDSEADKVEIAVAQLLRDFPTLRRINHMSEATKQEEVIAFRVGRMDFHFMVRKRNGVWYQKRGAVERIETVSRAEVFAKYWDNGWLCYTSPIILFAHTV